MGDAKADIHQKLAWATADRDEEAAALAEKAGPAVDADDARVAVDRAHGERRDRENEDSESEMASPEDAQRASQEDE